VWLAQCFWAAAQHGAGTRRAGGGAPPRARAAPGEIEAPLTNENGLNGTRARHKAAAIAAATGIPPVFVARVLANLQRQGFLNARAGQQGGYRLARPPQEITLLEVIEAVEGPLVTRDCVLRDTTCGAQGRYCVLHDAWSTAQSALRDSLAQTPLSSAVPVPVVTAPT
jgi:Rrf2 family protein